MFLFNSELRTTLEVALRYAACSPALSSVTLALQRFMEVWRVRRAEGSRSVEAFWFNGLRSRIVKWSRPGWPIAIRALCAQKAA